METTAEFGSNRTGIQSSPADTKELLKATEATTPTSEGDATVLASARLAMAMEADPLGSVPAPAKAKGTRKAPTLEPGIRMQVLVDKLAERLAFERTGTRLYEALLVKHAAYADELPNVSVERLQQFHAEEAKHFMLLTECLEELGADPTTQTPCADVAGVEGMGLVQVISEPRTTFVQSLNAILVAELADNDSWQSLIALARAAGLNDMAERFDAALEAEDEHLAQVRAWMSELSIAELRATKLS